ncbi:MAG TPA: LssY C-terminal domain-containing protein, partial [Bryobacteraceae bacterium]|nr:LssY C-terminal domain-containing protein [Bryobacteraceae bacterium]
HIRIWQTGKSYMGSPVWIAAATHDIGISFSRKDKTFTHSVNSDIDLEREKVVDDLVFTGDVKAWRLIARPDAPRKFQNATGDNLSTDGAIAIVVLN